MDTRKIKSYLMLGLFTLLFFIQIIPVAHSIFTVLANGLTVIIRDPVTILFREPPPPGSSEKGGIGPYLLGTLLLVSIASLIGIPISILAAAYSNEGYNRTLGWLSRLVARLIVEFPTIIIGLSVYGVVILLNEALNRFIEYLGLGTVVYIPRFSTLSGAIALAIVMIPYVFTQSDEGFSSIPQSIREAVYALGVSRVRVFLVLSGYIKSFIISGAIIGVAKILGETAPLLFTAFGNDFYVNRFPDILLNPIGSLTLWIFKAALSPYDNWIELAWAASSILILIILILFIVSRYLIYKGEFFK
ncbi:MAG: ABC transporter permease subunit [Sulfolobales archaeon]